MKAAPYRFYRHCTIDEDGIMTCHAGSGSELNISEEVFEFRLRDMESLNWMMRERPDWKDEKSDRPLLMRDILTTC